MATVPMQMTDKSATDYLGGHGPAIVGVSVSLCIVATILIALRFYTYFFVVRNKGGWSLLWATVAWVCQGLPPQNTIRISHGNTIGLGYSQYRPLYHSCLLWTGKPSSDCGLRTKTFRFSSIRMDCGKHRLFLGRLREARHDNVYS